jgi:flagellar biosynthetic protein FlhB
MADEQDDSQKTEEPSQKKLDEARSKGQVVNSREVGHWFMILAATVFVAMLMPRMLSDITRLLRPFLEMPDLIAADAGSLRTIAMDTFVHLLMIAVLPLVLVMVAALAGTLLQHGFVVSTESIQPKLEKISPFAGAKRLFSGRSLAEFAKGILKLGIAGAVGFGLVWPAIGNVAAMVQLDMAQLLGITGSLAVRMMGGVLGAMTAVAGLDYFYQRMKHMKSMRMTKQEIKDEYRQTEGDPMIKGRLRQIRMERARKRMMAAVPQSDVIITNPTHFAVALKYDAASMAAPRVVAKGADLVAHRIRALAREHDVPLVENPPLARALFAAVEVDAEVPPEHYKAVAEVIGYIMRLRREGSGPAGTASRDRH